MKQQWLHRNERKKLLLFFSGWACDERPFAPLSSEEYDVLMFYDYTEPEPDPSVDFGELFRRYDQVDLLAWSFGVKVAQHLLQNFSPKIKTKMAINGTCRPVDARLGIAPQMALSTLEMLSEKNLRKFQRRMLANPSAWEAFQQHLPHREWESARQELKNLLHRFEGMTDTADFYNKALIGTEDLIFPAPNQVNYWHGKLEYIAVAQAHFGFYDYRSWDEIITLR